MEIKGMFPDTGLTSKKLTLDEAKDIYVLQNSCFFIC